MTDPQSFGAWLRRERERRSITLRAIADRTKIGASRLEGLERGDISHWPGGIYRRAFARAYADAVGLDADLVVANFERVFPSDPSSVPTAAPALALAADDQQEMRLALAVPTPVGITRPALKAAGRDLACVLVSGLVGFFVGGAVGFWCAAAIVALAFHLFRVLGLHQRYWLSAPESEPSADAPVRAEVLSFTGEQERSTSRRARARRMLADISSAASSAGIPGRRRAARS